MKLLLCLYPAAWRARYGEEFAALLAESEQGPGIWADAVRGAVDAHTRTGGNGMKRLLPWSLLGACAVLIGWLNFHASDDVQPVAAALLVAGFGFGAYRPRWSWAFAVLLFLAVPVSGAYADAVNYHPGLAKPHPLYESVVALIPALLGAGAGAGARAGYQRMSRS